MTTPVVLRLALHQNFPTPLLQALQTYLPDDLHLLSLRQIDPRLSELTDRQLLIALHQLGWHGLITNNYKMLDIPAEVAAVVKTRAVLVAVEGLGHDPLRAVGALLLELPTLRRRLRPGRSNVLRLSFRARLPEDAWVYFSAAAKKLRVPAGELLAQAGVGVTDAELREVVLTEQEGRAP